MLMALGVIIMIFVFLFIPLAATICEISLKAFSAALINELLSEMNQIIIRLNEGENSAIRLLYIHKIYTLPYRWLSEEKRISFYKS
ncbi:CLUMA_CG005429, isoform A [Clunio marinus]|uniref:CLUMA_CG005429, isoform A n=1 Tax=Clunio marinus TaxID=568069 RepID=A0A1J1HUX0_9DIPT|nr:CLUMA_CG005429, isoform A [Clunio marinus]